MMLAQTNGSQGGGGAVPGHPGQQQQQQPQQQQQHRRDQGNGGCIEEVTEKAGDLMRKMPSCTRKFQKIS